MPKTRSTRRWRPARVMLPTLLVGSLAAALFGLSSAETERAIAAPLAVATPASAYGSAGTFLFAGQPTFPIALSNPPPIGSTTTVGGDALDEVVRAGVTVFRVGPALTPWTSSTIASTEAWDRAALTRSVRTWVSLGSATTAKPGSRSDLVLARVIAALTSDSSAGGIGLWKGADEPGWGGPTPDELRFAYCRVTGRGRPSWCAGETPLDPNHLWVTIEAARGTAAQLAAYSQVTDTHGVDVYPIAVGAANPDLHQVGDWTRKLASITPDHSVWTTLEICASGSHGPVGNYVLPTRAQERYMIYDAIINGARGLSFFGGDNTACWDSNDQAHSWNWTFWYTTLKPLLQEINTASPLAPALTNPGSTKTLATTDSAVEAISRVAPAPDGNQLWVLAAHNGTGTATDTIGGLPASARWASVYSEDRAIPVVDGSLTDTFHSWGVHVYHLALGNR
jgi:hypothetical protein